MVFWIIAALLLAIWILGLALKVVGGLVHVALAAAIILFVIGYVRVRRGAATTPP